MAWGNDRIWTRSKGQCGLYVEEVLRLCAWVAAHQILFNAVGEDHDQSRLQDHVVTANTTEVSYIS